MSRPLLITDCDEVLLHMVGPFGTWLGDAHAINFAPNGHDFSDALSYKANGETVAREDVWPLLDGFFETQMHSQTLIPHARDALVELADHADIIILTNLTDEFQERRTAQLAAFGIHHRVITNQGGKGTPVAKLIAEYKPSAAVFVDDLAVHHESVAQHAPEVYRIHMIGEPKLAPDVPAAPHAHARIDCWSQARTWIMNRFEGVPL